MTLAASRHTRMKLLDLRPPPASLYDDVRRGLSRQPRQLQPKHFYDRAGALLFDRITHLPEYYLTRTETRILHDNIAAISRAIGAEARIVEFGSGSGAKTRILLRHLERPAAYVPVDISHNQLLQFASTVSRELPHLEVLPVCGDYSGDLTLPSSEREHQHTVAFFPGSTIGNFETPQALAFLRRVRALCGPGGGFLIGTDLHKDTQVLFDAYNDAAGVTAAFNLNLLERINRECATDFDVSGFRHYAPYDETHGRIEMRLVAQKKMLVTLPAPAQDAEPARFRFDAGDYIITEYSHKYTLSGFRALVERTGWNVSGCWTDARQWFAVWLLRACGA